MNACPKPSPRPFRLPWDWCALFVLFVFLLMGSPDVAPAQYMFLDTNGDGISNDYMNFISADTSTVDVYLVTDRNQDGSPACSSAGLTSYAVNLYCPQSAAVFSQIENKVPGMTETFPAVATAFGLSVGYSGPNRLPPGKYHLFRVRVVEDHVLGCGALHISPSSCFAPEGVVTSFGTGWFGTGCASLQGDDILRYGEDWYDTGDFGGCTDFLGRVPVVSCPPAVTGRELELLSFPVSVFDPDCEVFSFYNYPAPAGSAFQGLGPAVAGVANGAFTWTPRRGQAATYSIKFRAEDGPYGIPWGYKYWDVESTLVTILPEQIVHEARAFTTSGDRVTRIPHGKPSTCFPLEPVGPSFALQDIVPSSLRLHYSSPGCGDHDLLAGGTKTTKIQDTDGNGLNELAICFGQGDLTTLLPCLGPGTTVLPLEITGSLVNGDLFRGAISQTFVRTGQSLAAISPNPITAASSVEFATTREGFASVQVFDVQGRKVGTALDVPALGSGYHRVPLFTEARLGARLASGVYFVRVTTEHDGSETRTVMVVR
jgi:hypothetical protein